MIKGDGLTKGEGLTIDERLVSKSISLPGDYAARRQKLVQPIDDYLSLDSGRDHTGKPLPVKSPRHLILDGTGPRLTIQLPYLNGMGSEKLDQFENVYAFSGGIGAYCVYLAQTRNCLQHDYQHYFSEIDHQARIAHKQSPKQYLRLARNYFLKKPLYSSLCYMHLFDYVMTEAFLKSPIDQVAPNFIPYIALPERVRPVALTTENGFDRSIITIADAMAMGMKIPHIYSDYNSVSTGRTVNPLYRRAFDATYTSGYWNTRTRLSEAQASTVILTTQIQRLAEKACVVDIIRGKHPNFQILFDIMTLVLNLPNKRYRQDLQLAYL